MLPGQPVRSSCASPRGYDPVHSLAAEDSTNRGGGSETKLHYRRHVIGDALAHRLKGLRWLPHRIWDIELLCCFEPRPEESQICDILCAKLGRKQGRLRDCEGTMECLGCAFQDRVPMFPGHSQHKIRVRSDARRELPRREARAATTQAFKDGNGMVVNRVTN